MDVLPWASSAPVASSTHAKSSSLPSAAKLRHALVTYLNKQREGAAAAETARHYGFAALKLHISSGERVPSVVVNNILQQNLGSSVVACIIGSRHRRRCHERTSGRSSSPAVCCPVSFPSPSPALLSSSLRLGGWAPVDEVVGAEGARLVYIKLRATKTKLSRNWDAISLIFSRDYATSEDESAGTENAEEMALKGAEDVQELMQNSPSAYEPSSQNQNSPIPTRRDPRQTWRLRADACGRRSSAAEAGGGRVRGPAITVEEGSGSLCGACSARPYPHAALRQLSSLRAASRRGEGDRGEVKEAKTEQASPAARVALPLRAGHINPMFQLGPPPRSRRVTVFHARFNAPDPSATRPTARPDGLPRHPGDGGGHHGTSWPSTPPAAPFGRRRLWALRRRGRSRARSPTRTCWPSCGVAAAGRAALVLRTGSAALPQLPGQPVLCEKGTSVSRSWASAVRELPLYRVRDLMGANSRSRHEHELMCELLSRAVEAVRSSAGFVLNRFDALEADDLAATRRDLAGVPVFDVGPLHKLSPASSCSLLQQDRSQQGIE
ncbi:hypothetical protein ZWY2020_040215 [Hordeum vulgare]|nr:hypothetical protein ZWY2020_040215 [Hordeum vulgare]